MSEPATRNHCRHIHPSGHRCASPSLRHEHFCYYHHQTRGAISKSEAQSRQGLRSTFTLLEPEDRTAIQLNLGEIIRRIAANELDPKRAGLLLYALQIAASNLPKPIAQPHETIEEILVDEAHGPIAPESEFQTAAREKTLEQILREQWAKDEEQEREDEAKRELKRANTAAPEIPPQPGQLPSLQATAAPPPLSPYSCFSSPINPLALSYDPAPRTPRPHRHPFLPAGRLPPRLRPAV